MKARYAFQTGSTHRLKPDKRRHAAGVKFSTSLGCENDKLPHYLLKRFTAWPSGSEGQSNVIVVS